MRYVSIMAGGSGTRLWPLSRKGMPKQMLGLVDGTSLLRLAFERAVLVVPAENVFVVTGAPYADAVAAQLPELPVANVLGEPVGRDSLNAAGWAAAVLAARDPDAVVAQLTADHLIRPAEEFARVLDRAFRLAEADAGALVTLGVVPTWPHTGFGYVHRGEPIPGFEGACQVLEFTEKPSRDRAEEFVASGQYWWNAGMFVWRVATFLDQLRALCPANYDGLRDLAAHPDRLAEIFPGLPKNSVDYAVMEPVSRGLGSAHVVSVPLDLDWRDVGGYPSVADLLPHDDDGNAVSGQVVCVDARGNVVMNTDDDSVVAVLGVEGLVVVHTPGATLVVPADQTERIKDVVAAAVAQVGPAYA